MLARRSASALAAASTSSVSPSMLSTAILRPGLISNSVRSRLTPAISTGYVSRDGGMRVAPAASEMIGRRYCTVDKPLAQDQRQEQSEGCLVKADIKASPERARVAVKVHAQPHIHAGIDRRAASREVEIASGRVGEPWVLSKQAVTAAQGTHQVGAVVEEQVEIFRNGCA